MHGVIYCVYSLVTLMFSVSTCSLYMYTVHVSSCTITNACRLVFYFMYIYNEMKLILSFSQGRALIPVVKHEGRDGGSGSNPYLAFRKRTEKMQTRKVTLACIQFAYFLLSFLTDNY